MNTSTLCFDKKSWESQVLRMNSRRVLWLLTSFLAVTVAPATSDAQD